MDFENSVQDFLVDPSVQIFILFIYESSFKESWMDKTSSAINSFNSECNSISSLLNMMQLNTALPLQLNFEHGTYELTFFASSNELNSPDAHWNVAGKIRRLYYEKLHAFWNISRYEQPYVTEEHDRLQFSDFNMILYTKRPKIKNIQENYLISMGNNCPTKCPIHHKHLVTCTYRYSKNCCFVDSNQLQCQRYNAYVCPVKYCTFSLCKQHLLPQSYVSTTVDSSEDTVLEILQEKRDINEEVSDDEEINDIIDSEVFPPFMITDTLQNADSICSSEQSSSSSEISIEDKLCTYNQDTTEENYDENESDAEDFSGIILPTTHASKVAHWMKESIATSIPLSVLLNKHLRLLVRRNFELRATKRATGFLERIVSTSDEDVVPILYPEGMIFPHIFFYQNDDGSIVGCIPSPLWTCEKFIESFGVASIVEHMRSRIKNSSLRCSTEPTYLFFAFDAISNALCFHDYPQLILSRGYEHMLRNASLHGFYEDSFSGHKDVIDPRRTVQELAAFLRDHDPTYFYTHTCNVREHFGVAPLQLWVDFQIEELRNNVYLSEVEFNKMKESYNQRLAVPLCRSWFRAGNYYMKYICESPEQPLGPIQYYWYRWEDNDKSAALQHLHSILCSLEDKNNPDDLKKIFSRVICSSQRAIQPSVLQPLFEKGLLANTEESIHKYYSMVRKVQEHGECSDRNYSCHRRTGVKENETQCRVVHHGRENPRPNEYSYVHINANHSNEARCILQDCNLLSYEITNEGEERYYETGI